MAMRLPATRLAVVSLALCFCLIHASSAAAAAAAPETAFPPGLKVTQDASRAAPPSCGTDDQVLRCPTVSEAVLAGEAVAAGDGSGGRRVDLELEDYPGSGANDRHSPWGQQRRN